jgi:hypothetical protein
MCVLQPKEAQTVLAQVENTMVQGATVSYRKRSGDNTITPEEYADGCIEFIAPELRAHVKDRNPKSKSVSARIVSRDEARVDTNSLAVIGTSMLSYLGFGASSLRISYTLTFEIEVELSQIEIEVAKYDQESGTTSIYRQQTNGVWMRKFTLSGVDEQRIKTVNSDLEAARKNLGVRHRELVHLRAQMLRKEIDAKLRLKLDKEKEEEKKRIKQQGGKVNTAQLAAEREAQEKQMGELVQRFHERHGKPLAQTAMLDAILGSSMQKTYQEYVKAGKPGAKSKGKGKDTLEELKEGELCYFKKRDPKWRAEGEEGDGSFGQEPVETNALTAAGTAAISDSLSAASWAVAQRSKKAQLAKLRKDAREAEKELVRKKAQQKAKAHRDEAKEEVSSLQAHNLIQSILYKY